MRLFIISLLFLSVIAQQPSHGQAKKRQMHEIKRQATEKPGPDFDGLFDDLFPWADETLFDRLFPGANRTKRQGVPVGMKRQASEEPQPEVPADCCEPRETQCLFVTADAQCDEGEWLYETTSCFPGFSSLACCGRCKCEDPKGKCYKQE